MAHPQGYQRPASAVVTLADPDNSWTRPHAEIGGTLEIRCESPNHPTFEVIFSEGNPFNKEMRHVFEGSIHQPVIIPLLHGGDFAFTVLHYAEHKKGDPIKWVFWTRVTPCPECNPGNQGTPGKK